MVDRIQKVEGWLLEKCSNGLVVGESRVRLLVDVDFWVTDEEELNCGRMDGEARRGTRGGADRKSVV